MPKTEKPKLRPAEDAQTATSPPWSAATPRSDIGGRSEQQDARHIFYNAAKGTMLIVVCDGVGGSRSGGEASAMVIKSAGDQWRDRNGFLPNPKENLLAMCHSAHKRICEELAAPGEKRAPAATIVALYLTPNEAHWVHSGDSRLYRFRDGELVSRTRDHSVVQILLEQGEITEAEMGNHPDQGRLLQSLGTKDYREPTYGTAQVGPTDTFLLCTDGFWERTPLRAMADVLAGDSRSLEARLTNAIARAVVANGPEGDNVTAVAVVPSQRVHLAPSLMKRLMPLALIGVGLLVAAVVVFTTTKAPTPIPQPAGTETTEPGWAADVPRVIPVPQHQAPVPSESKEIDLDTILEETGIRFLPVTTNGIKFYMAETELTKMQWYYVVVGGISQASEPDVKLSEAQSPISERPKDGDDGELPKCDVSPEEVLNWLNKLNGSFKELDGAWRCRLPTAAEWIATARGMNGDNPYTWGQEKDRLPDFGNWQPVKGKLLPVGKTNDFSEDWPFRDLVGNAEEIVTVPSDKTTGESPAKQFARFGSSYKTPKDEFDKMSNLVLMASDEGKGWKDWVIAANAKKDSIGFRLVLACQDNDSEKTAVSPPVAKPDVKDNISN